MSFDFLERDLDGIHAQFNQIFGAMPLYNPGLRIRVIFTIIQMGILRRKIKTENLKEDVDEFVRVKRKLNDIFERLIEEGRRYWI